jgi:hypothetical protein
MLVWLELVVTWSRLKVATLLSMPGTGWPPTVSVLDIGVLPSAFSEFSRYSGVCTAR